MREHKILIIFSTFVAIFFILFIPLLFSLSSRENFQNRNLKIRLVKVIGQDTERVSPDNPYFFFNIGALSCDSQGNIYVLDDKDISVKVFDKDGNFLRKILREGRGPEEIEVPYGIKVNRFSNHLFVLDLYGYEIKEFDLLGKFIKVYNLPQQIMLFFDFLDNERLIFINTKSNARIRVINLNSLKCEKEVAELEPVPSITFAGQTFVIRKGIIWTCHGDNTELTGYDFNTGKEVTKIAIPEKYEKYVIDKGINWWAARLRQYAQPIVLNDNLYVLFSRWEWTLDRPAKEKNLKLTLYWLRGGKLQKIGDMPEANFMRLGATWQNRLILFGNNPYPNVKIFEVTE